MATQRIKLLMFISLYFHVRILLFFYLSVTVEEMPSEPVGRLCVAGFLFGSDYANNGCIFIVA